MTRAISMDLRARAMARVASGQSVRQVAAALDVAPSSVVKWSQRFRVTGSFAPAKVGGRRPRKIVGAHEVWLLERIETPFTLRGLVRELAARGLEVDYRTVWSAVHRAGYSFKKNRAGRGTAPTRRRAPADTLEAPSERR